MSTPRILTFDIETSDLAADVGFMLCMGYKWLHEKRVRMLRIDQFAGHKRDTTNDRALVKAAADVLRSADILVSWYGRDGAFDAPFIRTRLLYHRLPPLPPLKHYDGQWFSRRYLRLRNNRLANAGALVLGADTKTSFHGPTWMRAIAGQRKALNYIVDHCKRDVLQTEQAYLAMRPYTPGHPNIATIAGRPKACPTCGAKALNSKGFSACATRVYRRWVCTACGAYCRSVTSERGAEVR